MASRICEFAMGVPSKVAIWHCECGADKELCVGEFTGAQITCVVGSLRILRRRVLL